MLERDFKQADELLGATGLAQLTLPTTVLELRWRQLQANPSLEPWLLCAIVHKETNSVVGNIGFHGMPNASYLAEFGLKGVEFGYTVVESERRKGFAKEASEALMRWACTEHGVKEFVLSISPNNVASIGLAIALGFENRLQYRHPDRGVENLFVLNMD